MHVDGGVGQGIALALGSARKQQRSHAGGHAQADGGHVGVDQLHRVVNRQSGADHAAGTGDVEVNVPVRVLALEKQQLGDNDVGNLVIDGGIEEDDPLLEQQ